MLLNFFEVFNIFDFFSQAQLTDEQRKYELIAVSLVCALSLGATVFMIVKNFLKNGKTKNDFEEKR